MGSGKNQDADGGVKNGHTGDWLRAAFRFASGHFSPARFGLAALSLMVCEKKELVLGTQSWRRKLQKAGSSTSPALQDCELRISFGTTPLN
jgi:hypothetical protein